MINISYSKPVFLQKGCVWNQIWMIMRLTIMFLTISTLATSAKSYSQNVSLSLKDVPVKSVFNQIRQQTGYSFLWNEHAFESFPPVSVSVEEESLSEALNKSLKGL